MTYTVVGWRGTGDVSFDAAITAVMIEGMIFFVLAVTGIRYAIIKLVRLAVYQLVALNLYSLYYDLFLITSISFIIGSDPRARSFGYTCCDRFLLGSSGTADC